MMRFYKSFWKFGKKKYTYAVNKKTTMIAPVDRKTPIKIAGYLEKRSKMRVVCRWKKLWFVLEGRLLLYYKSQLEYLSLSPCRGTVNLGLAANVAPGKSNEIIVSTRSNTVSLRALNRSDHDIWLQALMDAMHLPNTSHAMCCSKPVRHFRYSTGGLEEQHGRAYGDYFTNHARTLSGKLSPILPRNTSDRRKQGAIDLKLEKLARRFSKIAASDNTIPDNFKATSRDSLKTNLLRRSVSVEDEINRHTENIYETVDSTKFQNINSKRVIRSDSDCLLMKERLSQQPVFWSEQRIKSIFDSSHSNGQDILNKKIIDKSDSRMDNFLKMKLASNSIIDRMKDIKSDTDLTLRKHEDKIHTRSCNVIYRPAEIFPSSSSHDYCQCNECFKKQDVSKQPVHIKSSKKAKRSNSILKHFMKNKNDVCSPLMKKNSVKRRSLSFLKKIWRRKEPKFQDDISFNTEENDMQEIHCPSSEMAGSCNYSAMEVSLEYGAPLPEPPPDYGHAVTDDHLAPELPPRRGPTPWDEPLQCQLSLEDEPPALPIKKKKRKGNALDFLFQEGWDPGLRFLFNESENSSQKELSDIMAQLADINAAPLKYINDQESDDDPDYDIPRPHDSLLLDLPKNSASPDKMQPTNFFSHFEDSLDLSTSRLEEFTMAPDSLECDPWSLSESESTSDNWTPQTQIRKTVISSTYGTNQEKYFKDSLNAPHGGRNYLNVHKNFIQLHT